LAYRANKTSFKRGHKPIPGAGRAKGTPNKRTALLKDAILEAAAAEGSDGEGTDGLVGFLRHVARTELPVFCGLMRAVLPMQIKYAGNAPLTMILDESTAGEAEKEYANTLRLVASNPEKIIEGVLNKTSEEEAA